MFFNMKYNDYSFTLNHQILPIVVIPKGPYKDYPAWTYPTSFWEIIPDSFANYELGKTGTIEEYLKDWHRKHVCAFINGYTSDAEFLYGCTFRYLENTNIACIINCTIDEIKNCNIIDIKGSKIGHITNSNIVSIDNSRINKIKGTSKISLMHDTIPNKCTGNTLIGSAYDCIFPELKGFSSLEYGDISTVVHEAGFFADAIVEHKYEKIRYSGYAQYSMPKEDE